MSSPLLLDLPKFQTSSCTSNPYHAEEVRGHVVSAGELFSGGGDVKCTDNGCFSSGWAEYQGPASPFVLEEEDATEAPLDAEHEVILVDFGLGILDLRMLDPVADGENLHCFYPMTPNAYPSSSSLLQAAQAWIVESAEDRVGYYIAPEEEDTIPPKPSGATALKAAPKKPVKMVTAAALAEQVASLASSVLSWKVFATTRTGFRRWFHRQGLNRGSPHIGSSLLLQFQSCPSRNQSSWIRWGLHPESGAPSTIFPMACFKEEEEPQARNPSLFCLQRPPSTPAPPSVRFTISCHALPSPTA